MSSSAKNRPAVAVSHPDKVYFPHTGFTKGEMISYYREAAPVLLPHLRKRPVTLIRFPDGVRGGRFYSKNAPSFTPRWVTTFPVPRRGRPGVVNYIVIEDESTLAWCANLGAIELHPFLHRVPTIDAPTHAVFDLDPGEGANLVDCIRVALLLRELMAELGLEIFPKVSGSKGLQLYLPLNTRVRYESTGPFARAVAELLEQRHPDLVVSRMAKASRHQRVFIDWSQNSQSKTTVAVYSMRGKRDEPFISMPVTWEELERAKKKKRMEALFFTPAAALKRIQSVGDLFAPVLSLKQSLPKGFAAPAGVGKSASRRKPKARSKPKPRRARPVKRSSARR